MILVGLTGGIGSGKSTVLAMLAGRGAVAIDADDLARRAVEQGSPGFVKMVDHFGAGVLDAEGALDREALARVVFVDPEARRELEAIVHPEVARLFLEEVAPYRGTDGVVVYAVPLLVEGRLQEGFDLVVTVSAGEDVRVARLTDLRGMAEEAVRERVRAQATDEERERVADVVLRNEGSKGELESKVHELWALLTARAALHGGA